MTTDVRAQVLQGPWAWTVDAAYGATVLLCGIGTAMTFVDGARAEGWLALVFTATTTTLWVVIRRRPLRTWPVVALAGCTLALAAMPHAAAGGALLSLLAVMLLVLARGARVGAAYVALLTLVLVVSSWFWFPENLLQALLSTVGVDLFFGMVLVWAVLLRQLARNRADTAVLNAELRDANRRLRASLITQGELVLAEERAHQARELHDGLGHRLTLTGMSLEFARRMRDKDPDRAWHEVDRAAATNQGALDETREWVRRLQASEEIHTGASTTLEEVAESFLGTGLDVRVRREGDGPPLTCPQSQFATRLVQEGLTNVLKHATADRVDVVLRRSPQQVRLTVRDDGRPGTHDRASWSDSGGFGLRSLQERASMLGGSVTAGARPGGGFELVAELPVAAPGGGADPRPEGA